MAVSNLALSLSSGFGGYLYDIINERLESPILAFNILVALGAAFTASCWLLTPIFKSNESADRPSFDP
jgi:hypothetical protein